MQANWLEHGVAEQRSEKRQREILVQVVNTALARRLALEIEQMTEIMKERRANQRFIGARFLRQRRRLQRVLQLRDRFAAIGNGAVGIEEMPEVCQRKRHDLSPG